MLSCAILCFSWPEDIPQSTVGAERRKEFRIGKYERESSLTISDSDSVFLIELSIEFYEFMTLKG